ncbi:NAD(P)-dependent oxidoreductase [Georgenia sp. SUBG003]|uniref:NAD(P)-dependent oxidoreductase n=1 Tax=Georgenia sp. SUBG003 TaxID=1497974 RepID=UPI003AB39565
MRPLAAASPCSRAVLHPLVVELAVAEIIALTRRLTVRDKALHAGVWDKTASGSHEVRGRTLGIIGYGNIGTQLSVVAEALGLRSSTTSPCTVWPWLDQVTSSPFWNFSSPRTQSVPSGRPLAGGRMRGARGQHPPGGRGAHATPPRSYFAAPRHAPPLCRQSDRARG